MLTRPPPIQTHLMWTTKSGRELAFGHGHLALRGSGQGLAYRRNEGRSRIFHVWLPYLRRERHLQPIVNFAAAAASASGAFQTVPEKGDSEIAK